MTLEFQGSIDPDWLRANPDTVPSLIRALPSFVAEDASGRFVLEAADSDHDWDGDVWIWIRDDGLQLALVSGTSAWFEDVRALAEQLTRLTSFELVDDDGERAEFD